MFFFSKRRIYKYICSVIEKFEIVLQMDSSFRDANEAGANQQMKFFPHQWNLTSSVVYI